MRNAIKRGIKPRASDYTIAATSKAVFYRMHEGSGTTLADALGNGPALTMAGTTGYLANRGWWTPNGTDNYAQADANATLNALMRQDQAYGQLIIACDHWWDGSQTGDELVFVAGNQNNTVGLFGVGINSAGQVVIWHRGLGGSADQYNNFTGFNLAALANQRNQITVEIVYRDGSSYDANLYVNGSARSTISAANLLAGGASAPYGSVQVLSGSTQAYTLGARPTSASTRDKLANSTASNCRYGRLLLHKAPTRDATLAPAVAAEMWLNQGELPLALRGK